MQQAIKEMLDEELKNNPLRKASSGPIVTVDMAMRVYQAIKRCVRYSPGKAFTPIKVVIGNWKKMGLRKTKS